MLFYFLGGGACGCLITAVLTRLCQRYLAQRHAPEPLHCDHHHHHEEQQRSHTVRVVRIAYYLPPSSAGLTTAERNNLAFLRHLIASGRVSEEIKES